MTDYKDPFTLDGRLKAVPGVTKAKVAALTELVDETMAGSRASKGVLEEAMVSTDAVFNLAYLAELTVLEDFATLERNWDTVATVRTVSDFRPVTLYSLRPDWSGGGVLGDGDPRFVAPRIPEGATYPYAYLEQEVNQQAGGVVKRGFKTGFTFEAFINDSVGFLQALPESMRNIALDTDEWEVWNALITGVTAAEQLDGGAIPIEGVTVLPNAAISREALIRAIIELGQRTINGRKVSVSGGYKLIVASGTEEAVNLALFTLSLAEIQSGSKTFTVNGYDPLTGITVIGSEFVAAGSWYLIPNQNAARRPILELLRLVGHEQPELRVQGNTGTYVGGGAVSPFEGSFDNDSADFRLRMFAKGILWTRELIVWSNGSGTV